MSFVEPGLFDMIMRLRGAGVSNTRLLRAMETVPRSDFVPPHLKQQSYDEIKIPIACGQDLYAPITTAILCQLLDVQAEHKVLVVGVGSGYSMAILAQLARRVYGVERYRTLRDDAESRLRRHVNNVVLRYGDGRFGWRGQAPFDRILVCGSGRVLPVALVEQLAEGGKLIAGIDGEIHMAEIKDGQSVETAVMNLPLNAIEVGKSKSL